MKLLTESEKAGKEQNTILCVVVKDRDSCDIVCAHIGYNTFTRRPGHHTVQPSDTYSGFIKEDIYSVFIKDTTHSQKGQDIRHTVRPSDTYSMFIKDNK